MSKTVSSSQAFSRALSAGNLEGTLFCQSASRHSSLRYRTSLRIGSASLPMSNFLSDCLLGPAATSFICGPVFLLGLMPVFFGEPGFFRPAVKCLPKGGGKRRPYWLNSTWSSSSKLIDSWRFWMFASSVRMLSLLRCGISLFNTPTSVSRPAWVSGSAQTMPHAHFTKVSSRSPYLVLTSLAILIRICLRPGQFWKSFHEACIL